MPLKSFRLHGKAIAAFDAKIVAAPAELRAVHREWMLWELGFVDELAGGHRSKQGCDAIVSRKA
ncbi:hypothetical protein PO002_45655 [Cupriavidus necator]|uniref:hypothetical protein n=1 Tax=Cupriavidus necator TaxID=106590 RepID=UPI0039C0EA4B